MGEKTPVAEGERITYKGYFNVKDLYNVIEEWLGENWYDRQEVAHKESIHENGKTIDIKMRPWKTVTDYMKYRMHLRIHLLDVKEVVKDKKKYDDGTVEFTVDAFLETDHEGRWQSTAWFLILHFFYDRYVYSSTVNKYKKGLRDDVNSLKNAIQSYFNFSKRTK